MIEPSNTPPATMAQKQGATPPDWIHRSRLDLFFSVVGGPRQIFQKLKHTLYTLSCYFGNPSVRKRVRRLQALGYCDHVPSVAQLLIAGRDQILLTASEETQIFYKDQGIPWVFHNLRRFIQDPSTMMDPVGFFSHRDSIVHHILQTFHRHAIYDMVLLRAYEGGIEELDRQLSQLENGTHLHQRALKSLIEDGSYHSKLRIQVNDFLANPHLAPAPLPAGLLADPNLMRAMDQFKDVRGFMAYASGLEVGLRDCLRAGCTALWNVTLGRVFGKKGPTAAEFVFEEVPSSLSQPPL